MRVLINTAVEVPVNVFPLTDDTDFKTREVAVTYDAAGMDLVWNFVTPLGVTTQTAVTPTTAGNYDWTHKGDGMYAIEIPASGGASINNNAVGYGWFSGIATGVLPWIGPIIEFVHAPDLAGLPVLGDVVEQNTADHTIEVFARDRVTGLPKTGLVFDTAGLTCSYQRAKSAAIAITLVTQTVTGGHSDGGFVELDSSKRPGWYRQDVPDAVVATGQLSAYVQHVLAGVEFTAYRFNLVAYDPNAAGADEATIATAVMNSIVEGTKTLRGWLRLLGSMAFGKSTGGGLNYRDLADLKTRVAGTVDGSGNRTSVVLDDSD